MGIQNRRHYLCSILGSLRETKAKPLNHSQITTICQEEKEKRPLWLSYRGCAMRKSNIKMRSQKEVPSKDNIFTQSAPDIQKSSKI